MSTEDRTEINLKSILAIIFVFIGCCSTVIYLELLISAVPSSGNIITFTQFAFIALEGFIFTTKCGSVKPKIPITIYGVMVLIFFVVQVVNNYALNFNISVPLHMIFRSGSLMSSLILGVLIQKKSYKLTKYVSVILITLGITLCTVASANQPLANKKAFISEEESMADFLWWLVGIGMLTFVLFLSAYMGLYQEKVYRNHGKHSSEAMFYNHALPLPGFLLLGKDIYNHVFIFNQSEPVTLHVIGWSVPVLWLYLAANVVSQYVCIRAVFVLTTECQALTVTLVVTLRKFTSLMFSIVYFKNAFTAAHWSGAAMVFTGTLLFTEVFAPITRLLAPPAKQKRQ